jgi:hypothetical protein
MNHNARLAALALSGSLLSGCVNVGDFDVERTIAEQRVAGNPLAGLLDTLFAVPIAMDVDIASETAARDAGPAQAAHLKGLALDVTATAEGPSDEDDFGFLDSVEVFIESTRPDTTLPRTRIAQALDIAPSRRLTFDVVSSVDVLPYSEEGSRFVSEVEGTVPPDDVTFAGRFTLRVELF